MRNVIATGIVAVTIAAVLAGQAKAPPWFGAWELDVAQSEYRAGAAPRRETLVISPNLDVYKIAISVTDAGGRVTQTEAMAKFDGADAPVAGVPVPTMRAFSIVDDRTFEMVDKVNGLVTLRSRISSDGTTLTMTQRGVDEGGQAVDAVLRFVHPGATGTGIPPSTPPGAVRPGNGVTIPRLIKNVKPQYTAEAMRAKIQGSVLVECVVNTDGTVSDARVIRSLDATFGLDQEAIKAAKQWRFAPGTRNGEPVPVMVSIELTFTLGKD